MSLKIVEIQICNNKYKISCEREKEGHLLYLAAELDKLVGAISRKNYGKGPEVLSFLLASLTLQDKVLELTEQLEAANKKLKEQKRKKEVEYAEILTRLNRFVANFNYAEVD